MRNEYHTVIINLDKIMEQLIESIWQDVIKTIFDNIDIVYLCTFMLLAYLVKKNFAVFLQKVTNSKWKSVYTVLVLATVLAVPFLLCTETTWVKILLSYAVGTSLYELVISKLEDRIKKQ